MWEMEADWIEQIKCRRMKLKEMNEPERKGRERRSRAFLIRQPGANQRLRGAWARRSRVVREDDDLAGAGGGGWEGALKVVGGVMAAGSAFAGYGKKAVKGLESSMAKDTRGGRDRSRLRGRNTARARTRGSSSPRRR